MLLVTCVTSKTDQPFCTPQPWQFKKWVIAVWNIQGFLIIWSLCAQHCIEHSKCILIKITLWGGHYWAHFTDLKTQTPDGVEPSGVEPGHVIVWIQAKICLQRWTARHFYQCLHPKSATISLNSITMVYLLNSNRLQMSLSNLKFILRFDSLWTLSKSCPLLSVSLYLQMGKLSQIDELGENSWTYSKEKQQQQQKTGSIQAFFLKCKHAAFNWNETDINIAVNNLICYWLR